MILLLEDESGNGLPQDLQKGFVELIAEDLGIEIGFILDESPSPS